MPVVSMSDIAKSLNLSLVTVSMVMNGKADQWRISEKTRLRVLGEAKRLGYRRNANARAVTTGRTKIILCLERSLAAEPTARTLHGVVGAAFEHGYSVKPFTFDDNGESFASALHRGMEYRPAAVMSRVVSHEFLAMLQEECRNFNIPLLAYGSAYPMEWGLRVTTNDRHGGRLATEHLLSLGHRRIWFVGCPDRRIEFVDSRFQGFVETMAAAGIPEAREWVVRTPNDYTGGDMDKALASRLRTPKTERPTALFCMTDVVALKSLRIAREAGLSLPRDLSVAGYADLDMAKYGDPPLTTVAEPFEEIGRVAFEMMKNEIKNPELPSFKTEIHTGVDVSLVVRKSAVPPPAE